jgi:two-component system phosphate regulon sensor histidine kinase PhoR
MIRPRRKLFTVLFLSNFVLAGFLVLGLGWFTTDALKGIYRSVWVHHLEESLDFAEGRLRQVPTDSMVGEFRQFRNSMRMRVTLMDSAGNVRFDTDTTAGTMQNHRSRPEFIEAMQKGEGQATRLSATVSIPMLYVARRMEIGKEILILRMSTPLTGIDQELSGAYKHWGMAVALAILLGGVLAYLVSRRMVRPIQALRKAAERFAEGNLDGKMPNSTVDEVGLLADSLNQMAEQLNSRIRSIALQRNETEAVLSSLTEGVVALDHSSTILRVNQAFIGLFHLHGRPVLGKKLLEVVRNSELDSIQTNFRKEGHSFQRDIIIVEDAGERTLQVRGSALKDIQGQEIGTVLVLNDVSRVRKLEEMRSDFVSNVSHELKTPITSIKGYVETLQGMALLESDRDASRYLETVSRQADRLNAIVDDLLILSRIEQDGTTLEAEFQEINVADLVDSVVQGAIPIAEKNHIQITVSCPQDLPVNGNPGLLEQALQNLVANACKYSDPGKTVLVEVQVNQVIHITVRDQGFGIEKKHLPRIFERFYRVDKARSSSQGGTGLGLAIAKHIALMHHGRIDVQSDIGAGSTFTMILPRANFSNS